MNLKEMKIFVGGIQGSGKTELAKYLATNFKKAIVFTPHSDDWKKEKVFIYEAKNPRGDLPEFCNAVKIMAKEKKIQLVIFDDADLLFQSNMDIPLSLRDLHINHRHYNLALMFVSRRPQDIPTPIIESSHYSFILKCEGDNIRKKFNEINPLIWRLVEQIKYKDYKFVIKPIGEAPYLHDKINIKDGTRKTRKRE